MMRGLTLVNVITEIIDNRHHWYYLVVAADTAELAAAATAGAGVGVGDAATAVTVLAPLDVVNDAAALARYYYQTSS